MSESCSLKKAKKEHKHSFKYKVDTLKTTQNLDEIVKVHKEWTEYCIDAKVYCPFVRTGDTRFFRFDKPFHHVPPVFLDEEFCDFDLYFYTDGSSEPLTIFLGSKGENTNFEKVPLSSGSCLHVTGFSPYNWFSIAPTPDDSIKVVKIELTRAKIPFGIEFFESASLEMETAKSEFIDSSMLVLDNFFPESKIKEMISCLEDLSFKEKIIATLYWFEEPNEALDESQSVLSSLPWFSGEFIKLLEDLTNLTLDIPTDPPKWRRFKPGHYVILNDEYPEPDGLDLIFSLSPNHNVIGGDWVYLREDGEEVARFPPQSNSLVLVYRAPGSNVKRFKQYWNKFGSSSSYTFQMALTYQTESS